MRFSNKEQAIIRHNSHENRKKLAENAKGEHAKKVHGMDSGFIPAGTNVGEDEIDLYVMLWCVGIVAMVGILVGAQSWIELIAEAASII